MPKGKALQTLAMLRYLLPSSGKYYGIQLLQCALTEGEVDLLVRELTLSKIFTVAGDCNEVKRKDSSGYCGLCSGTHTDDTKPCLVLYTKNDSKVIKRSKC